MDIKFLPLVNMTAELKGTRMMMNRVIVEAEIRGKKAELVLTREEARLLAESISAALLPKTA